MSGAMSNARAAILIFVAGVLVAIAFVASRAWFGADKGVGNMPAAPVAEAPTSSDSSDVHGLPSVEHPRIVVDAQVAKPESAPPTPEAVKPAEDSVDAPESPEVAIDRFPYGRPTPDWVFEQKYAGLPPSEVEAAKARIEAEYKLASKKAFDERFDSGNYEIVPRGQSPMIPGDDRIMSGRSVPHSTDQMIVRLEADQCPEVYELFYEYLWLSTTR